MKFIQNQLKRWPEYKTLSDGVKAGRTPAAVTGLSGIHKCCVTAPGTAPPSTACSRRA